MALLRNFETNKSGTPISRLAGFVDDHTFFFKIFSVTFFLFDDNE